MRDIGITSPEQQKSDWSTNILKGKTMANVSFLTRNDDYGEIMITLSDGSYLRIRASGHIIMEHFLP